MNPNTTAGAVLSTASSFTEMPKQKMRVSVLEVDNGFLVELGAKVGFGNANKIAATLDDVIAIISDYLKQE